MNWETQLSLMEWNIDSKVTVLQLRTRCVFSRWSKNNGNHLGAFLARPNNSSVQHYLLSNAQPNPFWQNLNDFITLTTAHQWLQLGAKDNFQI